MRDADAVAVVDAAGGDDADHGRRATSATDRTAARAGHRRGAMAPGPHDRTRTIVRASIRPTAVGGTRRVDHRRRRWPRSGTADWQRRSGRSRASASSATEIVRRDRRATTRAACPAADGSAGSSAREDRWVVTPSNTVVRVAGSGDFWWGEWRMTYPDGQVYLCVDLLELRDGRICRETVYWAPPFDAPDWRRPFVRARRMRPS